jgi:hypothetical protein
MNTFKQALAGALLTTLFTQAAHSAGLIPDSANRRILSVKSQTLLYNQDYFDQKIRSGLLGKTPEELAQQVSRVDCGSVSVGNVQTTSTAISTNIQVVIVGDIINVGNRCQ